MEAVTALILAITDAIFHVIQDVTQVVEPLTIVGKYAMLYVCYRVQKFALSVLILLMLEMTVVYIIVITVVDKDVLLPVIFTVILAHV